MKKAFSIIWILAAVFTVLVACKKNDDGGGSSNDTYAATPVPAQACNMPGNTGCNPGYYQQNAPQFINYQWTNNGSFCGCPVGYRPVMNPQWGISCAPDNWFPNSAYYSFSYQSVYHAAQNTQWTSIPIVTYSPAVSGYPGNGYGGGNCYHNAASVCDSRIANSCTNGGTCRVTAGGSYMGICTYGIGNESYGTQSTGCWRYAGSYGWINVCAFGYGAQTMGGGAGMLPR